MARIYYHYCVDVFYYDEETKEYKLWYKESFSSKQNYIIWENGFSHWSANRQYPFRFKLSEPYVKYRNYKPTF